MSKSNFPFSNRVHITEKQSRLVVEAMPTLSQAKDVAFSHPYLSFIDFGMADNFVKNGT